MRTMKMNRILHIFMACVLAGIMILNGCDGSDDEKRDEILQLGVILPLDNDNGPLRENAIRTAIAEINANGGIGDDIPIELIVRSSAGEDRATAAAAAAEQISQSAENLVGLISSYSSSSGGIIDWMSGDDFYPVISGSATADVLSGVSPYFRRLAPPDSLQAKVFKELCVQYGIQSVALAIQDGDSFSESLAARFREYYAQPIAAEVRITAGDPDYRDKVNQILDGAPNAIFLSMLDADLGAEFLARLNQYASDRDWGSTYFLFSDALHNASIFDGHDLQFVIGSINDNPKNFGVMSAPDTSTSAYQHFESELLQAYGQAVGSFNAQFYDAAYIFALAMETAIQTADPDEDDNFREAVNAAISLICNAQSAADTDIDPSDGWARMKQAVANGAVNYEGASGSCDTDANGNTMTSYQIFTISGSYDFEIIGYYSP